jgi:XTP/dITP diphosphohydrolase
MNIVTYATSNPTKFRTARIICGEQGVTLEQTTLDVPEIQSSDGEEIARDKALRAFEAIQKPIIISDDSWLIPGLNNFPGAFMKYANKMLVPEDWLRLTQSLKDRRVILRQIIVYQDAQKQQLFYTDVEGILLTKIRGYDAQTAMTLVSFDNGKTSVAENLAKRYSAISAAQKRTSWHDFCQWYKTQSAK